MTQVPKPMNLPEGLIVRIWRYRRGNFAVTVGSYYQTKAYSMKVCQVEPNEAVLEFPVSSMFG
jgi:hypothetical protein